MSKDKDSKEGHNAKSPSQEMKKQEDKILQLKESEHKKLLQEAADYKDKYLRLFAEFDNARKRMERDRLEFVKYANEELIVEFLNILDDLERSLEAAKARHEDYAAFQKGIEMVMAHVYELLKKNTVKPIESVGKVFDPHYHEALMQVETDQYEDGVIVEEFQKGYLLGDRVVRTAKVKVAAVKAAKDSQKPQKDTTTDDTDKDTRDTTDRILG